MKTSSPNKDGDTVDFFFVSFVNDKGNSSRKYYFLNDFGEKDVQDLFLACGFDPATVPDEANPSALIGAEVIVKVDDVKKKTGKYAGKYMKEIIAVYPLDETIPPRKWGAFTEVQTDENDDDDDGGDGFTDAPFENDEADNSGTADDLPF